MGIDDGIVVCGERGDTGERFSGDNSRRGWMCEHERGGVIRQDGGIRAGAEEQRGVREGGRSDGVGSRDGDAGRFEGGTVGGHGERGDGMAIGLGDDVHGGGP